MYGTIYLELSEYLLPIVAVPTGSLALLAAQYSESESEGEQLQEDIMGHKSTECMEKSSVSGPIETLNVPDSVLGISLLMLLPVKYMYKCL